MKKLIVNIVVIFTFGTMVIQNVRAQGTITYLSNLGQTSTGSLAVGSDSWVGAVFFTGGNAGGYALNSIQLAMTGTSGSPSGFTVTLYSNVGVAGPLPGSSLGSLSGSASPTTAGTYTYTAPADLALSANTPYIIVLGEATTVANGAYAWSIENSSSSGSGGWSEENIVLNSNNGGSTWNYSDQGIPQFALNATPAPEPSAGWLALMGGGVFFAWRRWHIKRC